MLPNRTTLQGWNPDSLTASASTITASAASVADAVTGVDDACQRMPEARGWSGRSHEAAEAMFGRARRQTLKFSAYANAIAAALKNGSGTIAPARNALLNKAAEVDHGPLNVTDQWVVLVDPVVMSEEEFAKLQALAREEQAAINGLLTAVGDADDSTANAVVAAGRDHGFVEAGPSSSPFDIPAPQRPRDQVPNPKDPMGIIGQEAIRAGDEATAVRETIESVNEHGEEVTTVIHQDGSKQVGTKHKFMDTPSRTNYVTVEEFDKRGNSTSRTSSWHDLGSNCDFTSTTFPDGSNFTMSMDPEGRVNAGFTTATGRHSAVPVELIDRISTYAGGGLSGFEKHVSHGGRLPMLTAESLESFGKAARVGGPSLVIATAVFDMAMADTGRDRCIAAVVAATGGGGGWGGAELGALAGAATGPFAPVGVPVLTTAGAVFGAFGGADVGKFLGNVLCPY
ncbi:hypothetical protein BST13_23565 [Mycobacterium aquaticum]|uniref:Uncharacterized protein n=2 Tax=Mycobacterium aquaticum TaxID=1927124 RepID=A0A1X0AQ56_9MYCO|nr:hypothetical protein BST13_23565 [Mycobacterium aquaticum]